MFAGKAIETPLSTGFEPKLPLYLKSGRPVIIRKLDDGILN